MRLDEPFRLRPLLLCLATGALAVTAALGQNGQSPAAESQSEPAGSAQPAAGVARQNGQSAAPQPEEPTFEKDRRTPPQKRRAKKKTTPPAQSGNVVVRNGGAKEGETQLAPAMTKEQEVRNRENVNRLLATTEAHLKTIASRQLTPAQEDMRDQIRSYMAQSRAAEGAGDLRRAETLASKAQLLANELVKP
ncbi:MAG: hypothetical protein JOZ14_16685 [Acidobacteria bacterium]|nr:hypothetical protein [Acidobacteriota bacterium]